MSADSETILIKGGRTLRRGADLDQPPVADILVENGRIAAIGPDLGAQAAGARVLDARGHLVVPGFVNAHYHSHDVLLKGCFETIPLEVWVLSALPPAYPPRSTEEVRARTLLGATECLRSGMTTVQDMLTIFPFDEALLETVLDAYDEIGIRAVFSLQIGDTPGLDRVPHWRELIPEEYHGKLSAAVEPFAGVHPVDVAEAQYLRLRDRGPRLSWALGPTSPDFCSLPMLERLAALSAAHDLPVLTHIYESKMMALAGRQFFGDYGGSQVRFLQAAGLTGPRLGLAHSVWMLPEEIEILADTGTNVVINPVGNLKTRSGIAPIRRYLDAGVNVGLGCDNCSCSDAQNMFQAMKLFCGLAAVSDPEPGPPIAADSFAAATEGGAAALGLAGEVGALEPGHRADIAILDLAEPAFVPLNSAIRQLVFSEGGAGVCTVLVDGHVVMEDRALTTINESELRDAVAVVMETLGPDIDRVKERIATIHPYLLEAWRRGWQGDVGVQRFVGDATG